MKRSLMGLDSGPDKNTILLLHFDGNIVDATEKVNVTINSGSAAYTQGKFGQCLNAKLPVLHASGLSANLGLSDFTLDFWLKKTGTANNYEGIFDTKYYTQSGGICFQHSYYHNTFQFYYTGSSTASTLDVTVEQGVWTHIAVVRKDGVTSIYKNGILQGTNNVNPNLSITDAYIFQRYNQNIPLTTALVDELRFSNVARWTSNFNVPTKPY